MIFPSMFVIQIYLQIKDFVAARKCLKKTLKSKCPSEQQKMLLENLLKKGKNRNTGNSTAIKQVIGLKESIVIGSDYVLTIVMSY